MSEKTFEPKIVGIFCNWCSYRAADLAGISRLKYPPNIRIMRVMCSGRVTPDLILKALSMGADGVMVAGCHPGECHYIEQNYKAMRRIALLRHTLKGFGVHPDRIQLQWASASEGPQLAEAINKMVERLRELGPLNWPKRREETVADPKFLKMIEEEHASAEEIEQ